MESCKDDPEQRIGVTKDGKASKRKQARKHGRTDDTLSLAPEKKGDKASSLGGTSTKRQKHRGSESASMPLKGKIVALSSALVHTSNKSDHNTRPVDDPSSASQADEPESRLSYKELVALCHSAGAEVTSMVHKRVFCVIVTDAAAFQPTQRIRKAQKHGIPIVPVSWLEECLLRRKVVPFQHVGFGPGQPNSAKAVETMKQKVTAPRDQNAISTTERTVDLGCCCVCHEQGSSATCDWCVDCSYGV